MFLRKNMLQFSQKTVERNSNTVKRNTWSFVSVPEELKTQKMCESVVRENPRMFKFVPEQFKTQEMCERTVRENLSLQSGWVKVYIDKEIKLRKEASSNFQKEFSKLMNNLLFGKTMEDIPEDMC